MHANEHSVTTAAFDAAAMATANSANDLAEAVVRTAQDHATHRHLLDVYRRIESDHFLEESCRTLETAIENMAPYWDVCSVLASYARLCQPRAYLEIGVRRGRSAAVVAATCPGIDLFLFDMWHPNYAGVPNPGPEFVQAQLDRVSHCGQVHFFSGRSQHTVPAMFSDPARPQSFSLITVDGDHRDAGARADLDNIVQHLAPGGMIAFDDIAHPEFPSLHAMWKSFLSDHAELVAIENTVDGTGTAIAVLGPAAHRR